MPPRAGGCPLRKSAQRLQPLPAGDNAESRIFSSIGDILGHYGRTAPEHAAIISPGGSTLTYGELWARANETVRALRHVGVGPRDRVAVALADGADAAATLLSVAA